ncbi:hypothetical protein ACFXPS_43940 [Nocardia sp. NPDC059091]|uniref:hypothetical protein n=1 Tax=unclassified Nocardia TaxID=2637762 RepID=UPI0036883787
MASRDIVVTVGEDDWLTLNDAAECAGMSVAAYVCWAVRLMAMQARPAARNRTAVPLTRGRDGVRPGSARNR